MAVQTTTASDPLVTKIVTDTDSDTTIETPFAVAQKLYFVEVTNPNGSAVYTKILASSGNSNSNQTQHYIQLYCPANTTCYMYMPTSVVIASGLQFYSSVNAGTVNSQTNPTDNVIVKLGATPN